MAIDLGYADSLPDVASRTTDRCSRHRRGKPA